MEKETLLETTWREHGYPSTYKLYLILRKEGLDIRFVDVDAFVGAQKPHQLHKKIRHSIHGHIVAYCKDCLWFADLLDMRNFSRQNKGFHWILLCADIFTRMAFAEPLKRKTKVIVKEGFEAIMGMLVNVSTQRSIQLLVTDSGSEFLNQPVLNLLRELKIEHRTVEVGDHFALGIIDRLSRTMKEMIFQDFTERGSVAWYDQPQQYIDAYNSNPHRSIGNLSPDEAAGGNHDATLVQLNVEKTEVPESKFAVGDIVRSRLKRPTWKKGYKQI
jgi:transposase InsO family protein